MGGVKTTLEAEINPDHLAFLGTAKEKYGLSSEAKALRVIMDYVLINPDIHDTLFKEIRCLRCE